MIRGIIRKFFGSDEDEGSSFEGENNNNNKRLRNNNIKEELNEETVPVPSSLPIPLAVLTDSYKASHFLMYPEASLMVAYGEFRGPFEKDSKDNRFVFYGIRYIVENFLSIRWTEKDVEVAENFYSTHNAGFTPYAFPKELFIKFIRENNGYFPIRLEALTEGTVGNVHVPVYQIFARNDYARLLTFFETLLTQVWYPSTVATLSRRTKQKISEAFEESVDSDSAWLLESRLHDFGFRGCTCVEQSVIGGVAHLLNFSGSDTMSACFYAQYVLNNGKPVGSSIPATEHSVMTSWKTEREAIQNMIQKFGGENHVFACVMDSYDYSRALNVVLPSVADEHKAKGGLIVLRPDSGDPVECVIMGLKSAEKCFGVTKNKKGYKVIKGAAVIQGDGINYTTVGEILDEVLKQGFSAQNVAFGMGGGLLQKVNRDTMQFATKLSFIVYKDGTERLVMKKPATDSGKISLPGILKVERDQNGQLIVKPRSSNEVYDPTTNELKVVYDHGPVAGLKWESFDSVKARVEREWKQVLPNHDPISPQLKQVIATWKKNFQLSNRSNSNSNNKN